MLPDLKRHGIYIEGILRHMRQKITIIQNHKNKGIFSQKLAKNAPKSIIYLFFIPYPFVTNSLKSATSQNFPTFFTKTP